ncbi:hypothetical protein CFC35_15170 [Streptomyces sp. FBKL.4005]|nr:hypothetical protein [Streptomyces sp. SID7810]OYP15676.1 hypothetical protein CFC35_15170 [Streptomyces sp. FBKL.4005]
MPGGDLRGGRAGRRGGRGLRRRGAGHTRCEGDCCGRGDGGRSCSFHLSAQVLPLEMEYRANSPFTRSGVDSHVCTSTPRSTQYAGG